MKVLPTILLPLSLFGFSASAEVSPSESTRPTAKSATHRSKKKVAQRIELNGSKVAEVTTDGEVWVDGDKAGEITKDGEIWVAGEKEGDLTKTGEVWKAGDKVGDVTKSGEVWREGDRVGNVEKDGTIWIDGSREGRFKGGKAAHAAVIVFYGFFDLDP